MQCPKCNHPLHELFISLSKKHHASHGKKLVLKIDQCFTCNGIWFDANELQQYLDWELNIINSPLMDPVRLKKLDEKVGNCPRCDIPMVKEPAPSNPSVIIDKCRECNGIWLDCAEIEKLKNVHESTINNFLHFLNSLFK